MDHLRDEATFLPFFHELIFAAITTALGFLELFCNVSKADLQQDDVNHIPVVQLLYGHQHYQSTKVAIYVFGQNCRMAERIIFRL